jgi:dihydrodipicolinate synthase/N-acetylneuraminate lyase
MRTRPVRADDWRGVFPVPPLARTNDSSQSIDFEQSRRIAAHIAAGGIRNFLYGGNAFLYHIRLREYHALLDWLTGFPDDHWMIPSAGPSFGRAMDQADLLKNYDFPCAMLLPCADPRDAKGLERGYRSFADAARKKLILYLKEEHNMGADKEAGLDAVARMVDDGICVGIKYAVVRENPAEDAYLTGLLRRVDKSFVISGIGERPAIVHTRDFELPGFTTGSGCLAPALSRQIWELCDAGQFDEAEPLRRLFLPVEDLRDAMGPARVLHAATELAGIAKTGPIEPYITALDAAQCARLLQPARELVAANQEAMAAA